MVLISALVVSASACKQAEITRYSKWNVARLRL
jgi:hypothetical protein